jgi:superfamily II DNA or RNA helicase
MASFAEFLTSLDADSGMRGKQFEHFVKWFLRNDPEWATQVDKVWLWNDYPERWGRDCGIDLVFKDKNDATWAVQAKCYSSGYEITKPDVDRFLSESNRKTIDHRLLITTTDRIGANARQVLDGQEKSVVRYHLTHFENAAIEYPDNIERLSTGKRKPPPEARPHQVEAVANVISGFEKAGRGQLIMACGTGKTFVCLWVRERLKAKRTLVLVPSLGLLSQILNDWTLAARQQFDALCVCSDQTVNRKDEDEPISLVADLAFPVSSDVAEIAHFLRRDNDQVIFSTYQSSPLIADAQKKTDVPHFDLVIADEAHRCAGKAFSSFGTVLDAELIKSDRRLFATATPRVYTTGVKKAAEEFGVEVIDMADEKGFGQWFHTLSFSEAIKRNLLTDYRVLIVGVDDDRIKEWIEKRLLVETDTGLSTDARSLAGEIGLLKAIRDWNLRRIISFHGRVKRAREFSVEISHVAEWLKDDHKPSANLWADYVSGEMPTISRRQKLRRLKNIGNGEIGLLSNARCLSEGVDVPALDGIAFIDPRSSEIDIIQSVGRAIRLSENKTIGTIVIPVFIEQTDDAETALEASEYKPIWDVLEALKSHDNRLSDELDQLRIELGAKRKRSVGANDLTKIIFDLPTSVGEDFAQSLRAHLVAQTTESWMFWYGLLEEFVKKHRHCNVPFIYKSSDGYRLGGWINQQRLLSKNDKLSAERIARLDALEFIWDVLEAQWEEGFDRLKAYVSENKHCRVPQSYQCSDGYTLGRWVQQQRNFRKKDKLSAERIARLDALGFIWDPFEAQWEEGFEHLKAYVSEYKNCKVPQLYISSDGYRLGSWINHQTLSRKRGKLSPERIARLDALQFIWDSLETQWEEGFDRLKAYVRENKHCNIPAKYKSEDGFPLGYWLTTQGQFRKNGKLSAERIARLDALGVIWGVRDALWEKGFSHLKMFLEREGHSRVPDGFKTDDGYRLGAWVGKRRSKKDTMEPDRRQCAMFGPHPQLMGN